MDINNINSFWKFSPPFASMTGANNDSGYMNSAFSLNPMQNSVISSYQDKDLMSIIMQQQMFLNKLFEKSPNSFDIGMPSIENISNAPLVLLPKKRRVKMRLSKEAQSQIEQMAQELNMNSKDIKALIYAESGGNPQAVNPNGGATGLIQFMPKTAKSLGTSTQELYNMSAEQQLVYVKKYLERAKRNAGFSKSDKIDSGTLYALVFLPAKVKKDILCSSGSIYYKHNKGLDLNKDGHIAKNELGAKLQSFIT